jgi:hypothetical protein
VTASGGRGVRPLRGPALWSVWRRPCRVQHWLVPANSAIQEEPQGWNPQARGTLNRERVGAPPSAHPARSKPRAGIRQRRARHRPRRRLRAVPCRRRPRPAQSLAAQRAGTHRRHIRPRRDSRGDSRLRGSHRAARHRPRHPAAGHSVPGRPATGRPATGPTATARTGPRPAAHGGRRRLGARVPRRRLRGRRHRRGRHAVAAPGRRVARSRDRAGTAPWRAGARLRGLAHLRHGRARRAAPLAAPDRRAQRRRGARAVA